MAMTPHRTSFSLYALLFFVLSTLLIGFTGGLLGGSSGYGDLTAPPLAPPSWVFPVVWTLLYLLMGLAAYLVWQSGDTDRVNALRLYYIQLFVNALWTLFFFRLEWRLFAFLWILLLIALILWTAWRFRPLSETAALLLLPYLLWCLFAAYLNLGFYILNR